MLIYEVTATVEAGLAAEFERYVMGQHIPDVLATGKLTAAFFVKNGDFYRVGYHCDSYEDLDAYLANDAERLRADHAAHFPSGVEVSRQVWDIVALFPSPE
jgi:hypothetical protein